MQAELKSHVLKFWRPEPKTSKMPAKEVGVFVTGYNEVVFVCNATDRQEIRGKNVSCCPLLNLEEF